MNITLKDVPPALHERLRRAAEQSGRSLNRLILHTLDQCFSPRPVSRARLLRRIRQRREAMTAWLEDEPLQAAIREGRR